MEHSSRANRESHFKKLLGHSLVVRRSRDKMACEEPMAIKNFVLDTINVFYKHTIIDCVNYNNESNMSTS